jgi:hypothetical protein
MRAQQRIQGCTQRQPVSNGHRLTLLRCKNELLISSGTGIEREPDAKRLLTRGAFRPFQLFGDTRSRGLPFRHCLQLTNFA